MSGKRFIISLTESEVMTLYEYIYSAMIAIEGQREDYRIEWQRAINAEEKMFYSGKETECRDKMTKCLDVYQILVDQTGLIY